MVTYDTTFGGWNAIVTEDVALSGTDSAAGIVFFPGIGEMTTNVADLAVNGPHYLINNGLWDGGVSLGNGVHHPFIISLQPPGCCFAGNSVKPMIDAILKRYRIKRNSFYMTGLSMGGWQANQFVCYEPTKGDDTYGRMVKAMVILEGVEPADSTGIYSSLGYPRKMGHWAKACGGKELWVEGSQDWRDMLAGAQNMNDSVAGSATYFQVTYGGGAHCCWNTEYQPSTTWTIPTNSNISQLTGTPEAMNVWQWLLRQGDTTMPASETSGTAPVVNAGGGQTVTLPTSSVSLKGTAKAGGTAAVASSSWTQVSGPNTATIAGLVHSLVSKVTGLLTVVASGTDTVSMTVSGLVAGTYVFQLAASDNDGLSSSATVTIVVNAASVGSTPPTVSVGSGQSITLPTSSVTLTGKASGNGGAIVKGLTWKETSGPVTVAIASYSSLSTVVSGMTVAGNYVFAFTATDNNGLTASASVTVAVAAAAGAVVTATTVSPGSNQIVTLPTSSATLSGAVSAGSGKTISGYNWQLTGGPGWVRFGNEWAASTAVTGLVAGKYTFTLSVTDNSGVVTVSPAVTVTVNAAGTTSTVGSAVSGLATGVSDSAPGVDSAAGGLVMGMRLYPNPVHDLLNIRLYNAVTGKVMVSIFNMVGNRVRSAELEKDGWSLETAVDVSRLPAGVYMIEISDGPNLRTVQKFIKQ